MAPLSAALANGDDTLSITADCYSTAGTDAAITAALLAYYTSSQVDTLLGDYRTGAAQDTETCARAPGPAGRGGSLAGPAGGVCRPPRSRGPLLKLLFGATSRCLQASLHPGNLDLALLTRQAARPRRDAGHGLRGAEGRCRRHSPARWASQPPRGRTTGCGLVVMDVFTQ